MTTIPDEVLFDYQNRTVLDAKNPRWDNAEHTSMTVDVLFAELESLGYIPFGAVDEADTTHGQLIWDNAIAGLYGLIAEYVPPVIGPEQTPLTNIQFYTMLEVIEKMTEFEAAIETLTPASKKIMMRNTYRLSTEFTWDMELMTLVAPIVWGVDWQDIIADDWMAAKDY